MECQSRAMVELSSSFEHFKVLCEYGSSAVDRVSECVSEQREYLLFVGAPKFVDGASAVLVGK